ncbi:Arginase/deacetylase [Jaminaea rosea]|uniref:histone deacetylase n=1 Tax=Jaminaea rosea TaxID=1569628 RepID=A0A316UUX8_9BASI|nr:Arginase/deacetylase [Jaminaea rosea]PWN28131.1 Arginase/deacetylase [Jaminaea rosea]
MSQRQPHRRVSYIVSTDLIEASDALPSNLGRSSLVHSLVHHLGLLDISTADGEADGAQSEDDDSGSEGSRGALDQTRKPTNTESERSKLLKVLGSGALDQAGADICSSPAECSASPPSSLHQASVLTPSPATDFQLTSYHAPEYIRAILNSGPPYIDRRCEGSSDESYGLVDDCPRFPLLAAHARQVAGAAISAAKSLLADDEKGEACDVAICWDGGRHHAHKARAAGFCYVNDAVLAILELKRPRKVAVREAREEREAEDLMTREIGREDAVFRDGQAAQPLTLSFGARPQEIQAAVAAATTLVKSSKRSADARQTVSENGSNPQRRRPAIPSRKRRMVLKRLERILYLDLDLHWGDGVEEAFSSGGNAPSRSSAPASTVPSVLTISLHNSSPGFYPPAPPLCESLTSSSHLNIPLPPQLGRPPTLNRLRSSCLAPLLDAYSPEAIVVQCGVDGLAGDPCRAWKLDLACVARWVAEVQQWAQEGRAKVLLLGGGGYHSPNAARAWASLTALALGRLRLPNEERRQGEAEQESTVAGRVEKHATSGNDEEGTLTLATPIPLSLASWPAFTADGGHDSLDVPAPPELDRRDDVEEEDNEDERYLRRIEAVFAECIEALRSARGVVDGAECRSGKRI